VKRREFIAGLGGAVAWPALVKAQQQTKPTIGWLDVRPEGPPRELIEGFRRGLAEVGISDGRDVRVEYHTTDGHYERLTALAAELVSRKPAAIVAPTGISALAAKQATRTIPIIFAAGGDPVEFGLVASLNHPGGNLTGVAGLSVETASKRIELLHKTVPTAVLVAVLLGPGGRYAQAETRYIQSAARALGLRLLVFNVTTDRDIAEAFATLVEYRAGAVVVGAEVTVRAKSSQILSLAARFALPTMFSGSREVREGGLMCFGNDVTEITRQLGVYTGRILKDEKPADLPVQQPTRVELVINLKTAKALGLTIPETLLATADEVIQ
jgi:putative tryptophan/tyrosine transport system substrate-binding protein